MSFLIQQRKKKAEIPSLRAMVQQYSSRALNLCCCYTKKLNKFLWFRKQIKTGIKKIYYSLIFFDERVRRTFHL